MLALVLERVIYFNTAYRREAAQVKEAWEARPERKSWYAHQVRTAMISQVRLNLEQNIGLIKTFVAICPLCGLLGTVTGMIEVFDVMAALGSGNARAMASGVSKATIPTMAGMVGAMVGVFAATFTEQAAEKRAEQLEDSLTLDH
ncbi:MAG: MotA/TolQ/ExbB proton channel family protein [Alphaproteobacteria bacterium]|nr:MAG: MotA/TolQ/ExbB proton channel family protein [Alphaproteobacteria bacterium]